MTHKRTHQPNDHAGEHTATKHPAELIERAARGELTPAEAEHLRSLEATNPELARERRLAETESSALAENAHAFSNDFNQRRARRLIEALSKHDRRQATAATIIVPIFILTFAAGYIFFPSQDDQTLTNSIATTVLIACALAIALILYRRRAQRTETAAKSTDANLQHAAPALTARYERAWLRVAAGNALFIAAVLPGALIALDTGRQTLGWIMLAICIPSAITIARAAILPRKIARKTKLNILRSLDKDDRARLRDLHHRKGKS